MKGKFIKKLVAYALTAAMVVSTPMTAFASEFADNFYQSSGNDADDTHTDTGTVSSTDTETNTTVLKDYATDIKGIRISPSSVVMNVGEKGYPLQAEIIYAEGSKLNEDTPEAKALRDKITKTIRWESLDSRLESSGSEIVRVNAKKNNMSQCTLNANKAGFAVVTASLDYDYDGTADIIARVNVMVKRNITKDTKVVLEFGDQKFYAGHTYDLYDFVTLDGDPAVESDDIAFTMTISPEDKKDAKKTAVDADGFLTVDKGIKKTVKVSIQAKLYLPDGTEGPESNSADIELKVGNPVGKVSASSLKEIDIAKAYNTVAPYEKKGEATAPVTITVTGKNSSEPTTDDIKWTSNNENVAKVVYDDDDYDYKTAKADIVGVSVGKAKITAEFTNGKKVNYNITVKASLIAIEEVSVANNTTWSGKTTPVIVKRVPAENIDKLKLTVIGNDGKKSKFVKVKNLNIIPVADLKGDSVTVTVNAEGKNASKQAVTASSEAITVKQSNVTFDGVARTESGTDITKLKQPCERLNPSQRTLTYYAINPQAVGDMPKDKAAEAISWESSKDTIATVDNGKLQVVGEGTATITVSCVSTMKWSKKDGWTDNKGKYKQTKFTFKLKSTPKCEEIVLKSDTASGTPGTKVTLNVKQQLPRKAADEITWYIDADGNGYKKATSVGVSSKDATDKKLTYTIPTSAQVGDAIQVLATTGSVSTEATIYVVEGKIKKVEMAKEKSLTIGQMEVITVDTDNYEPIVRYDVDKNGVKAVKVLPLISVGDEEGRFIVCGIGEGKATISAVSASGKSAKIKITVTGAATTN